MSPRRAVRIVLAALVAATAAPVAGASVPERGGPDPLAPGEPVAGVAVTRDVPYGPGPLTLDLYAPERSRGRGRPAPRPAVVWVHGGGWTSGDKAMPSAAGSSSELARRGYVTASIGYRLLGPGGCPRAPGCDVAMAAAKADVARAIRWLRARHVELGIDRRRIALAGSSAGAITALLVGADPAPGARVSAVVSLSGGLPAAAPVGDRAAPALLLHGTADDRLSPLWSIRAAERLRAAGASATLRLVAGGEHDLWLEHGREAVRAMAAFLAERLAAPPDAEPRRRARAGGRRPPSAAHAHQHTAAARPTF